MARPLTASGSLSARFGTIEGQVAKRAVRVRVRFRDGRPPLQLGQLGVVKAPDRYPVNFFIGFYPADGARGEQDWPPSEVAAFDAPGPAAGPLHPRPAWNTRTQCPGD